MAALVIRWPLLTYLLLRVVEVLGADTPTITPDEFGSWAIGRHLFGGDPAISMRDLPPYPLVPGLLTGPVELLGLDPVPRTVRRWH